MIVGIVVTAFKLESWLVQRFKNYYPHGEAALYVVTDQPEKRNDDIYIDPDTMPIFSITRCSNLGIRAAIDGGCDVVIKTDIDCIIGKAVIDHACEMCVPGRGAVYRYWQIKDAIDGPQKMDPRCVGTCAMTAQDWIACGGYDEEMCGYGYDDADIIYRAADAGIELEVYPLPKVYHWDHEKHNRETCNPVMRDENKVIGRTKRAIRKGRQ